MVANFPTELLARRHPVLDRVAENAPRGRLHEPPLAPVTDPSGQVDLAQRTHFQAYTCQPNYAPFWSVPDSVFALYSHGGAEDESLAAGVHPGGLDFAGLPGTTSVGGPATAAAAVLAQLSAVRSRRSRYPDQEVTADRDAVRQAIEDIAPGGADLWDPRDYRVDRVIVAWDAWPTDWHRR
jgi:hypothetical protein